MKQITGEYVSLPIIFVIIDDPTVSVQVAAMQNGIQSISLLGVQIVKLVKGSRICHPKIWSFRILFIFRCSHFKNS